MLYIKRGHLGTDIPQIRHLLFTFLPFPALPLAPLRTNISVWVDIGINPLVLLYHMCEKMVDLVSHRCAMLIAQLNN